MVELRYKMIMALSAADLGSPLCEKIAGICAEVAERHFAVAEVSHPAGVAPAEVTVIDVSHEVLAGAADPYVVIGPERLA
ncbi:hypothetical protein [Streptomyces sp. NPDC048659]|uniref:hypothetical protein n=1 Tax=Streptomyces sp. NPDC048659 TaxID=3155489 RepID=UPI0034419545